LKVFVVREFQRVLDVIVVVGDCFWVGVEGFALSERSINQVDMNWTAQEGRSTRSRT
jgi:hypothetical protein